MAKSHLKLVTPTEVNRTVAARTFGVDAPPLSVSRRKFIGRSPYDTLRYVFMAEELLEGPARGEDAIERADRMISRLRPDTAIEGAILDITREAGMPQNRYSLCFIHPAGRLGGVRCTQQFIAKRASRHMPERTRTGRISWRIQLGNIIRLSVSGEMSTKATDSLEAPGNP
jgi:hypothetical protein